MFFHTLIFHGAKIALFFYRNFCERKIAIFAPSRENEIDISHLKSGICFLRTKDEVVKIVKLKKNKYFVQY